MFIVTYRTLMLNLTQNLKRLVCTKVADVINQNTVKVAIIGVPNSGKSTFINSLTNHRVCPTSQKVHTTQKSTKASLTVDDTQIILFDTPGLVTEREIKKHNLLSSFKSSYRHSIQKANLIGVIHDASNQWNRNFLHKTVLDALLSYKKIPSFLVINKIDMLKSKRLLLDLARTLTKNSLNGIKMSDKECENTTGWEYFSAVFMVSSLTHDGINDILPFIRKYTKPGKWEYLPQQFTDLKPENLIEESVRARLLDYLPQEIPYSLKSQIEYYTEENNTIYASVQVICPSPRIERLICGQSNGKIRQITERVTSDLVETFGKRISLSITTKARKSNENKA